jgi:hydroxymethylbilane synthase
LNLASRIRHIFETEQMLPAAGQGALGIEICTGRSDLLEALSPLVHNTSWLAVAAERAVSRSMGGSCSMPLAAHATLAGQVLSLRAAWGDPEGATTLVTAQVTAAVNSLQDAEVLGQQVADDLRRGGAR